MDGARVALVVPTYNEAGELDRLCEELARLAGQCEAVVVDGRSDDGSRAALGARASSGGFRVLDAARGRARQMNAGARATSAPVLLFVHADTRLPAGALAEVLQAVDGGAVGGSFRLRIASVDPRLRLAARLINLRSRVVASATGDQAIFVTRAAFERLGGFRPIELCEDLDLVRRLRALGRFVLIPAAVETSARRWECRGVGRTIALMWALRLAYHLGVPPNALGRLYGHVR